MDLYRKVAYDWENRRCILPDNLRQFRLAIKVYDIRNFQRDPGKYLDNTDINENKKEVNTQFLGEDYSQTTQINFILSHCEFMPDDSGSVFGSISNSSYEQATQTIKISYQNISEDNVYKSLVAISKNKNHYFVKDYLNRELQLLNAPFDADKSNSAQKRAVNDVPGANNPNVANYEAPESRADESNAPDSLGNVYGASVSTTAEERKSRLKAAGERAKQEVGDLVGDIEKNISAAAANLVKSKISSLLLGNVYGFSASTTAGTAKSKITNAPFNLGNSFGKGKN